MTSSPPKKRKVKSSLTAALDYAHRGWLVIPVHTLTADGCSCHHECSSPAKHPRTRHGIKDATTDEETIRQWWDEWPDANVAIVAGAASGLVVLDVDPRHGGDESLRQLEEEHGPLPPTPKSRTGGGGQHLLFAHPGGRVKNKANLAPGLDIRADAGYIVAPPSLHTSGQKYEWDIHPDDSPLAPTPQWLLALIEGGAKKPKTEKAKASNGQKSNGDRPYSELVSEPVQEGGRNNALASLAGYLRRGGFSEDIIAPVLETVNEERCDPPLSESEVEAIAKSVSGYPPEFPLETGGVGGYQGFGIPPTTNNNRSLMVGSKVDYQVNAKAQREQSVV